MLVLIFDVRYMLASVFPLNAKKCEFAKLCPADSQLKFNNA